MDSTLEPLITGLLDLLYTQAYLISIALIVGEGSRVESIEDARKEYKQLLKDGWKKTNIFKSYF